MGDEMDVLLKHMPCTLLVFARGDGEQLAERIQLAEVTDTDGGVIEFAFDMPTNKQRVYLRLPQSAVLEALKETP